MTRKPDPTNSDRSQRFRQRRKDKLTAWEAAFRAILSSRSIAEAQRIAREALSAPPRSKETK